MGVEKQTMPEASASAIHMVGITHVLNAINSFCSIHKGLWILDSRASEHMSSELTVLHGLTPLTSRILVNLPNGTQVKVTQKGRLQIAKGLVLNDVLLVPNFKFIYFLLRNCVDNYIA